MEVQEACRGGLLDETRVVALLDSLFHAGADGRVPQGWVFECERLEQRMEDRRYGRLISEMVRAGRRLPAVIGEDDARREFAWMDTFQKEHPLPPELLGF